MGNGDRAVLQLFARVGTRLSGGLEQQLTSSLLVWLIAMEERNRRPLVLDLGSVSRFHFACWTKATQTPYDQCNKCIRCSLVRRQLNLEAPKITFQLVASLT